jgi:serine/threonine-protein kinase
MDDMAGRDMQHSVGSTPTDPGREEVRSIGDFATRRADAQHKHYRAGDRILGRYRILGELGQGGMGVVFRCFDETGGIEVALKAVPPEVAHDTGEMEEVRENFRLVAGLVHQNIAAVKTLEHDPETRDYYLVMEKVEGINLRQWRKQVSGVGCQAKTDNLKPRTEHPSRRTLPEILPLLRQAAAALDYAHSRKIVHRDIKPSNVMVGPDGTVKVLDFGLAAQIQTSMSRVSMVKYGTSGTGPYMAPEQ